MKASEEIKALIEKANRDLPYKAPEVRDSYLLKLLGRALELVEAQEKEVGEQRIESELAMENAGDEEGDDEIKF